MSMISGVKGVVNRVVTSGKHIIGNAGIALVEEIARKMNLERLNVLPSEQEHPGNVIPLSDIVKTEIATICCGDPSFEGIRDFRADQDFYAGALGMPAIPSPERVRQRLDIVGSDQASLGVFHSEVIRLNNQLLSGEELTQVYGFLPVDMDVTPFDESKSKKENVSMTYKKCMGYAPNYMYVGKEGFMMATEFRPGKQHCQKGTPEFISNAIESIRTIYPHGKVLLRMDSGNDSMSNYGVILEAGMYFICKRNLRKESPIVWLEHAKKHTLAENIHHPREGKTVYIGSTWMDRDYKDASGNIKKITLRVVYEITERTMEPDGQFLMPPTVEANLFCTNTGLTDYQVIEMYHQHANCEQCHSELKTDLDFEKVPSGKFNTNIVLNDIAMLAFNILRCIGMRLFDLRKVPMRGDAFRRRLGTVIRHIMRAPAMVIDHARYRKIDLGRANPWAEAFTYVFTYYKA